jgi:hypothetical protein
MDLAASDPKIEGLSFAVFGTDEVRLASSKPHASHALSLAFRVFKSSPQSSSAHDRSRRYERPFHEVWCPSTFEEADSDSRGVCLAPLRCAFRFSQPLGALFHLQPFRPCFVPVTPLGFCHDLQRIPPPDSRHAFRRACPSCRSSVPGISAFGRSVHIESVVSGASTVVPLLAFASPRSSLLGPRSRASTGSPLMGFIAMTTRARRPNHHRHCSTESQRTRGLACLFRGLPSSLRFMSSSVLAN